jgi:hypothetical protein
MEKCKITHNYVIVGNPSKNKKSETIQIVYCTKCGKQKEIVTEAKKD